MALAVVVALVVGATIALQAATISRLSNAINPLTISLSLLVSGLLVGGVWAILHSVWTDIATVGRQWWWLPLGAAGWLIVGALGWTSERLGVAQALALVIGAQLSTALVIDVARGPVVIGPCPVIGLVLIVVGTGLLRAA
jgi:uncharacterized membrane protein YdcZ (DUF606 family)